MDALLILKETQSGEINIGLNKYVNPKKDTKFSPNLYRYLTWHKNKHFVRVYQDAKTDRYYIGHVNDGWFAGCQLMAIFCYGSKAESFAWEPKSCSDFKDITEWFWQKYFEIGKAIYDLPEWHTPNYLVNAAV